MKGYDTTNTTNMFQDMPTEYPMKYLVYLLIFSYSSYRLLKHNCRYFRISLYSTVSHCSMHYFNIQNYAILRQIIRF